MLKAKVEATAKVDHKPGQPGNILPRINPDWHGFLTSTQSRQGAKARGGKILMIGPENPQHPLQCL
jgi:hypothetical protein